MTKLPATHAPQSHTTPNPPHPTPPPKPSSNRSRRFLGSLTPRTIAAPLAAFTMALILYAYSVTSIRAAKRNAALHRAADGGQLDMRRESLRRHGVLDKVEGTKGLELFRDSARRGTGVEDRGEGSRVLSEGEAVATTRRRGAEKGAGEEGRAPARTEVEGGLESWKGREGQERWKGSPPPKVDGAVK